MDMLKDRLESKCLSETAAYHHLSVGFSLLGWLELLQKQLINVFSCFTKSFIYRERFKKHMSISKEEKVNFTLLNLAIAFNNWIYIIMVYCSNYTIRVFVERLCCLIIY